MSTKQLNRIVLHACGCTPQHLVAVIKCEKAKEWMHESAETTLCAMADALGFSSEYSFIRCFKRVEGMPPGTYRKTF